MMAATNDVTAGWVLVAAYAAVILFFVVRGARGNRAWPTTPWAASPSRRWPWAWPWPPR